MSRDDLTLVSLLIHIPAVTGWVGLVMFDAFVSFLPGYAPVQRARVIASTRWLTLLLLAAIIATGVWQTMENPFLKVHSFSLLEQLREHTIYGKALFVKHIFVIGTFSLSLINRFYLAPRLRQPQTAGAPNESLDGTTSGGGLLTLATVTNLAFCLGVLLSTARMTIELH